MSAAIASAGAAPDRIAPGTLAPVASVPELVAPGPLAADAVAIGSGPFAHAAPGPAARARP